MTEMGDNIGKDPVQVSHAQLKRASEESPFRSWCPVCEKGILLVSRDGERDLSRVDRCMLCGQLIVYEDDEIAGVPLEPSLDKIFGAAATEGYRHGCRLCGKSHAYPGAIFCGAACCARWEAGERPKWPTRWERLVADD